MGVRAYMDAKLLLSDQSSIGAYNTTLNYNATGIFQITCYSVWDFRLTIHLNMGISTRYIPYINNPAFNKIMAAQLYFTVHLERHHNMHLLDFSSSQNSLALFRIGLHCLNCSSRQERKTSNLGYNEQ